MPSHVLNCCGIRCARLRIAVSLRTQLNASDVVQETVTMAARDLGNYQARDGAPCYAWLQQIARRQLLRARERYIDAVCVCTSEIEWPRST